MTEVLIAHKQNMNWTILHTIIIALLVLNEIRKIKTVIIHEYQKGLLFKNGKLIKTLNSGTYLTYSNIFVHKEIVIYDTREQSIQITGQEILTNDNISLKVNIIVQYKIIDPEKVATKVVSIYDHIHQSAQLLFRNKVADLTFEEALKQRNQVNQQLTEETKKELEQYGIEIQSANIKDIMLTPELKAAYTKTIQAQKEAEAALISARETIATTRALANAAQMAEKNPGIIKLKELEILSKAANTHGNTFVVGLGETKDALKLK